MTPLALALALLAVVLVPTAALFGSRYLRYRSYLRAVCAARNIRLGFWEGNERLLGRVLDSFRGPWMGARRDFASLFCDATGCDPADVLIDRGQPGEVVITVRRQLTARELQQWEQAAREYLPLGIVTRVEVRP